MILVSRFKKWDYGPKFVAYYYSYSELLRDIENGNLSFS